MAAPHPYHDMTLDVTPAGMTADGQPTYLIDVRPRGAPYPSRENVQAEAVPKLSIAQLARVIDTMAARGFTIVPSVRMRERCPAGWRLRIPAMEPVRPGGSFSGTVDDYMGWLDAKEIVAGELFVYRTPGGGAGGAGPENDCLFHCLQRAFSGHLPFALRSHSATYTMDAAKFKQLLGLGRSEFVPVALLPKVDAILGKSDRLEVATDDPDVELPQFATAGKSESARVIRLRLRAGHYTLDKLDSGAGDIRQVPRVSGPPARPYVWAGGYLYSRPPGAATAQGTPATLGAARKWLAAQGRAANLVELERHETVEPAFDRYYTHLADLAALGAANGGWLPPYSQYASMGASAISFFQHCCPAVFRDQPDMPGDVEAQWIARARLGGLQYCVLAAGEAPMAYTAGADGGRLVAYDVNSSYPAAAVSKSPLPWKRGEWKVLPPEDLAPREWLSLGLYRCVGDPALRSIKHPARRFVVSTVGRDECILASHDLLAWIQAARAGLCAPPKLVHDGEPNACLYGPAQRRDAQGIFGTVYERMMKSKFDYSGGAIRKRGGVKRLAAALIGALEQRNTANHAVVGLGDDLPCTAANIARVSLDVDHEGAVHGKEVYYRETGATHMRYPGWARVALFVKAKARLTTGKLIRQAAGPTGESVLRVHTDGWAQIGEAPADFKLDPEALGGVKIEHGPASKLVIENVNRVCWGDCKAMPGRNGCQWCSA